MLDQDVSGQNGLSEELTDGEDDHGDVAAGGVEGGSRRDEADRCNCLGEGDVPRALVELAGAPGDENGDRAGDEVGRASEDQADSPGEAQGVHDGGELDAISFVHASVARDGLDLRSS